MVVLHLEEAVIAPWEILVTDCKQEEKQIFFRSRSKNRQSLYCVGSEVREGLTVKEGVSWALRSMMGTMTKVEEGLACIGPLMMVSNCETVWASIKVQQGREQNAPTQTGMAK